MCKVSWPYVLLPATYRLLGALLPEAICGEHIAMAMVVVGHICTQNVMGIHNTIY